LASIQKVIDLLFLPFSGFSPGYGLAFATFLVTLCALAIYKYTSNQKGIKKVKERIKAHFVEIWLFIDDPILILKAQAGIFSHAIRYLAYALIPLAIMFLPVLTLLINCEYRYHYRPFQPGEVFLLKLRFSEHVFERRDAVNFELPPSLELTAPPLRLQDKDESGKEFHEIDYRLKVNEKGNHTVKLSVNEKKQIEVRIFADGSHNARLNPVEAIGFPTTFWHPGTGSLKTNDCIEKIEVQYPQVRMSFFGWEIYWVWPFLILMFIFAFALKPIIKVEF
jgi:hypothetical protein